MRGPVPKEALGNQSPPGWLVWLPLAAVAAIALLAWVAF